VLRGYYRGSGTKRTVILYAELIHFGDVDRSNRYGNSMVAAERSDALQG
jgi:hypothetical protein